MMYTTFFILSPINQMTWLSLSALLSIEAGNWKLMIDHKLVWKCWNGMHFIKINLCTLTIDTGKRKMKINWKPFERENIWFWLRVNVGSKIWFLALMFVHFSLNSLCVYKQELLIYEEKIFTFVLLIFCSGHFIFNVQGNYHAAT